MSRRRVLMTKGGKGRRLGGLRTGLADGVRGIVIDGGDFNGLLPSLDAEGREGGIMVLMRRYLEMMEERKQARIARSPRELQRRWDSWNYRRLQAQEQGREFNEPTPKLDDDGWVG